MNELVTLSSGSLTMSSREIAELTGKQHTHVLRDIRTMLEGLQITESSFGSSYKDPTGRTLPLYNLPKDLTITLVSGYNVQMRHRIVTRWQELESKVSQPAIPQSLPEALRLAADLAEQKAAVEREKLVLEEKVAEQAPKVEALDLISAGKDSLTITETAKILGKKRNELTTWMHANSWVYRLNGAWVGYDRFIKNGCLEYKEANYTDEKTGMACKKPYCHVTPKGLTRLAENLGCRRPSQGELAA